MRKTRRIYWWLFGLVVILSFSFFAWLYWHHYQRSGLEVVFLDVGQGDAILFKSPDGQNVLLDGGEDGRVIERLEKYLPWWDRSLDLVILTHPHRDHAGGLLELAKRWPVEQLVQSGAQSVYPEYLNLIKEASIKKIPIKNFQAGQKILLGNLRFEALSPSSLVLAAPLSDEAANESSLVFMATYGQHRFLLTGDIGEQTENNLLSFNGDLSADVLKIAHHGSEGSSSEKFLRSVSPHWAVIEVGSNNKFGHPGRRVLHRLERLNVPVLRTDLDGDVRFWSDGQTIRRE